MYILLLNKGGIASAKGINSLKRLFDNEIEITEEQYNQINEFPLKLTIKDGKVVAWEKIETEHEPTPEQPKELTETEMIMLAIAELDMQREIDKTETELAIAELAETLLGGI